MGLHSTIPPEIWPFKFQYKVARLARHNRVEGFMPPLIQAPGKWGDEMKTARQILVLGRLVLKNPLGRLCSINRSYV